MLSKSSKWELGFVHYIAKFTISRFVISRFECASTTFGKKSSISRRLHWNSEQESRLDLMHNVTTTSIMGYIKRKSSFKCKIFNDFFSYILFFVDIAFITNVGDLFCRLVEIEEKGE